MTRVAIIGAGAAGMFCAANSRRESGGEAFETHVFEASGGPLKKVLLSGGGRCNLTNSLDDMNKFVSHYPRGGGRLRRIFRAFGPADTREWFETRGVPLKEEALGRVFPKSDSAKSVADCLMRQAEKLGVRVHYGRRLETFSAAPEGGFRLSFSNGEIFHCDRLMIATGSFTQSGISDELEKLGHRFSAPLPSLFGLKLSEREGAARLAGISLKAELRGAENNKIFSAGEILFTHAGLSGPALLALSSFGARELAACSYKFPLLLNFLPDGSAQNLADFFNAARAGHAKKQIQNFRHPEIPERLWRWILERAKVDAETTYANLSKEAQRALEERLLRCEVEIAGRAASKDEFVTCGGLELDCVNLSTMQSLRTPKLFFGGEFLNIDALTGGFNLQNAWSTGMICARNIYLTNDNE